MKRSVLISLAAALLAGMLIAGCGEDGGDSSSDDSRNGGQTSSDVASSNDGSANSELSQEIADKTMPKAEFVKRANAICGETIQSISSQILPPLEEEEKKEQPDRPAVEAELVTTVAIPELRSEVEQIQALGAPPGDERRVERILASINDLIEEAEANPEVLVGTNEEFEEPAKLAEDYGLKSCPYG